MILYNIQDHGELDSVPWLVKLLQHSENSFLLTCDSTYSQIERLKSLIFSAEIFAKEIVVERSEAIHWCGPSQARNMLSTFSRSLALEGWEYFVNLSGACVPLKSQGDIKKIIYDMHGKGIRCHMSFFKVDARPILPTPSRDSSKIYEQQGRLFLKGSPELLAQFKSPEYFPVRNIQNRPYVACEEPLPSKKVLDISRPCDADLSFRESYFSEYPHYAGRSWFIFHREVIEALVKFSESWASIDWRDVFLRGFEPDESFIQTALLSHSLVAREKISNSNLRHREAKPSLFSDEDLNSVLKDDRSLFARKIAHQEAPLIIREIEKRSFMK